MICPRCGCTPDPARLFCTECGALVERRQLSVWISTDDTRGRALDALDRIVGLHDSDAVAEAKAREHAES